MAERPDTRLTPSQWIRANLFATRADQVLTVVLGAALGYAALRLAWFVLVSSNWEIIRSNLRRLMIGTYPVDEAWRLWVAFYVVVALAGLLGAATIANAEHQAQVAGRQVERPGRWDWVRRYWPVLGAIAVVLSQTRTWTPTLLTLLGASLLVVSRWVGRRLRGLSRFSWLALLVGVITVVQIVAGPGTVGSRLWGGLLFTALVTVAGILLVVSRSGGSRLRWLPWFGWLALLVGVIGAVKIGAGSGGVEWRVWGGLLLTAFVTVAGIALAFPLGVLLALGRRSSLPVLRWINMSVIELLRGVPLVALLFLGHYVIPLLYPNTAEPPSPLARALVVITLFEAAYIAETVRGGLQAIPRGQYEAAQAIGLRPWNVTRLIVLPQALRAVIPAMVGQFISLYKDTSLLQIIGFVELLQVAESAVSQESFLGQRLHTVTFTFAALIYWAGSYTLSRESRRLEQRLGVGGRQ